MTVEMLNEQVELQNKLDSLKKNRAALSEEDLQNKYGKAYNKLLDEIKQLKSKHILNKLNGIYVAKNSSGITELWNSYLKKIDAALYEEYSVEKADCLLEEFIGIMFTDYHSLHTYNIED